MQTAADIRRSVPATPFDWAAWYAADCRDYGEPGATGPCPPESDSTGDHLAFNCPGCGRFGMVRAGAFKPHPSPSWQITAGSRDEVATLSLTPSLLNPCCGWHGHLTDGVFRSCCS